MMTSSYSSTSSYRLTFSQLSIEKQITSCFLKTYYITENYYNSRIINDIIYNEKSHIVSLFKDNLIIDDCSEFLKRYYTTNESQLRLPRFFEYHETYSRIYPNYTAIPESKYIYKNIHKKQKIIDQQQNMEMSVEKKNYKRKGKDSKCNNNNNNNYDKQVFSTEVCYSLANDSSLMRSIFGLAKKRRKHSCSNKNINSEYDNNNNGNTSVNEVEKLINIIDKHQRAVNVHGNGNNGNIKHKKHISSCNHHHYHHHSSNNSNSSSNYISSTTRGKQPIHGLSKIYTDPLGNTITTHNNKYNTIITSSHQITLSNHNINEHNTNTNTILNYNNNTYKIAQNQHTTRLPTKHITTLSKDIHKKVNELHLPKSSSATGNNSMINHTHRKTNSAYNAGCCYCCSTKEKIKVNTASAKATFEVESIKNRIKRLSSKNNNNNGKITYRNRIIPNKNNTLGVRTTNNSLNSYNKTNQTHCSTIKSNKHLPIKNSTIYTTTPHIIKRLIPQSSKNRTGSNSCKRKNGSGAKTERIVNNNNNVGECGHQQQQQQNAFEIALLKQIIAKTKSNSQTKGNNTNNEYKPILSARGSSSIIGRINNNNSSNSNSKHKGSKHISSTNSNSNSKQGINKILKSNNEKKISVNTLNKNTYHYKNSNTSQKNILTPNTIHDEHTTQHNNKHTNIVKGIQIKNFNKVIALASSSTDHKTIDNNYSDNSHSNSNNNKAINVNIKTANTKYLSQTTRNIHQRRSDA